MVIATSEAITAYIAGGTTGVTCVGISVRDAIAPIRTRFIEYIDADIIAVGFGSLRSGELDITIDRIGRAYQFMISTELLVVRDTHSQQYGQYGHHQHGFNQRKPHVDLFHVDPLA